MNSMKLEFDALSCNEALARSAVAAFAASENPTPSCLMEIRTAVSEAVTNAIVHGYGGKDGKVTLKAWLHNGLLTVTVSDNGVGIPDIPQAMQPFYTTADGSERSGIGFSVMQSFSDSLDVTSSPGKGTVVTVTKRLKGQCA